MPHFWMPVHLCQWWPNPWHLLHWSVGLVEKYSAVFLCCPKIVTPCLRYTLDLSLSFRAITQDECSLLMRLSGRVRYLGLVVSLRPSLKVSSSSFRSAIPTSVSGN